jgi:TRAP transporter TAXI family solute receptor
MIMGTSATTGTVYPVAVALGELLGKYTDTQFTAQTTAGPNENIRLVSKGDADMGYTALSNLIFEANLGEGAFKGEKIDNIRVLWSSAPDAVLIFAREDSGIRSIRDMAGKRIGTGPEGMSCQRLFGYLLNQYGLARSVREIRLPWNDAYEAVGDGDMDGMFLQGGWPNAGILSLATSTRLRFFELTAEDKAVLTSNDKTLIEQDLPANIYQGQNSVYHTLAGPCVYMVNKDMADDVVYTLTKTVMEHIREYDSHAAMVRFIGPETALKGIPLEIVHPGALRYYKEIGLAE